MATSPQALSCPQVRHAPTFGVSPKSSQDSQVVDSSRRLPDGNKPVLHELENVVQVRQNHGAGSCPALYL